MIKDSLTRRAFGLAPAAALQPAPLTAARAVERIKENLGVEWRLPTIDTFKAGRAGAPVKGIATTFIATLPMLGRAVQAGLNLIITHEPTFFGHTDRIEHLAQDPVYQAKRAFLDQHGLVIWRFHDHWHMRRPDPVTVALSEALGLRRYASAEDPRLHSVPETTLARLAADCRRRMNARAVRFIGDPAARIRRVALFPGSPNTLFSGRPLPEFDVCILGENTEWEGGLYAQDMIAEGRAKGLILLGHQVSEEPGMKACAAWLKTFITEVPVEWIPSGEPFHLAD